MLTGRCRRRCLCETCLHLHRERESRLTAATVSSKIWKNGTRLPYWILEFKTKSVPSNRYFRIFVFSYPNLKFSEHLSFLSQRNCPKSKAWGGSWRGIIFHLFAIYCSWQCVGCTVTTSAISMLKKSLIWHSPGRRRAHWFFTRVHYESSFRSLTTAAEPFDSTDKTTWNNKIKLRWNGDNSFMQGIKS